MAAKSIAALAKKRDALTMAATSRVMPTQRAVRVDTQKVTFKAMLLGEFKRNKGTDPRPFEVLVLEVLTLDEKGPAVKCPESEGRAVPVYERIGDKGVVAFNVCLNRVKVGGAWEDDPRMLAKPIEVAAGTMLRISVGNDAIASNLGAIKGTAFVTLTNCAIKLGKPKTDAAPPPSATTDATAAAAAAPVAAEPAETTRSDRVFWNAESLTIDETMTALPAEHAWPTAMPFETNLLPSSLDIQSYEQACYLASSPPFFARAPVFRLSLNRDVLDRPEKPDEAPYVMPDEETSLTGTKNATITYISANINDYDPVRHKNGGTFRSIFAMIDQYHNLRGDDDAPPKPSATIGLPDIKLYPEAFLSLGLHNWKLIDRFLFPAHRVLPPVPGYVLVHPDMNQARLAAKNGDAPAGCTLVLPQCRGGPAIFRVAEYVTRFGVPVSEAMIKARYVDTVAREFTFLYDMDPFKLAAQRAGAAADYREPVAFNKFEYTFDAHCGYVPLDGLEKLVPKETAEFAEIAAKFKFYAVPIVDVASLSLEYPLEEETSGLRHCTIKDAAEGDAFVLDVLRKATNGIAKLKVMSNEALLTAPDAWIMNIESVRYPRWTFWAVPRAYTPMDPAMYLQPSSARGYETNPKTKRPRDEDEEKKADDAAPPPPQKKARTEPAAASSGEDKMDLDQASGPDDDDD